MVKHTTRISMQNTIQGMLKQLNKTKHANEHIHQIIKMFIDDVDNQLKTSQNEMFSYANITEQSDIQCLQSDPISLQPSWCYYTPQEFRAQQLVCTVSEPDFIQHTIESNRSVISNNIRFTLSDGSWMEFKGTYYPRSGITHPYIELCSVDKSTKWMLSQTKENTFEVELCYFLYKRKSNSSNTWFHIAPGTKRFARDMLLGMKNAFILMAPPNSKIMFTLLNYSKIPKRSLKTKKKNKFADMWLTPFRIAQGQPGFYEECGFYDSSDVFNVLQKRVTRVSFRRMPKHQKIQSFRRKIKQNMSKQREKQLWTSLNVSPPVIKKIKTYI